MIFLPIAGTGGGMMRDSYDQRQKNNTTSTLSNFESSSSVLTQELRYESFDSVMTCCCKDQLSLFGHSCEGRENGEGHEK